MTDKFVIFWGDGTQSKEYFTLRMAQLKAKERVDSIAYEIANITTNEIAYTSDEADQVAEVKAIKASSNVICLADERIKRAKATTLW